jgi:hypothetical protein
LGCNGEANKISQHGNAKGKTLKVFERHSPRPGLRHLVPTFPWPYAPFAGNSNRVSKQVNTVKEGQREKKTIDTDRCHFVQFIVERWLSGIGVLSQDPCHELGFCLCSCHSLNMAMGCCCSVLGCGALAAQLRMDERRAYALQQDWVWTMRHGWVRPCVVFIPEVDFDAF